MMEMQAKVFVTQIPNRRDRETGAMVPSFNISPAAEYGEIHLLMPAGASFYASAHMVSHLRKELRAYSFERGDAIVPAGDPSIIMATGAVLAEYTKQMRVLKWDRQIGRYIPVEVNL
jgi:hypothetical protein